MITIDYVEHQVPVEIIQYCDKFTYDADHDDLRHIDCVYMHMGVYGNDPSTLQELRWDKISPVIPTDLGVTKTDLSISGQHRYDRRFSPIEISKKYVL